jgi:signal transduction histidine kinase
MRTIKDLPIRWKLVLVTVLTCAIAELVAGAIVTAYTGNSYAREKSQEVTVQADVLAASLAAPLVFGDKAAAQEYLDALKADREIAAARIYGADGTLFAKYRRGDAPHNLLPATAQARGQRFEGDRLLASQPVVQDGMNVGSVSLAIDTVPLMSRLLRVSGLMLLAVMGSLLIAVPIATRLNATISNPIHDIAQAASRVTQGDFQVELPEISRSDEVGVLARTFSKMVASIRDMMQQERLRALGQMSSGIAHDINNAMSPVALYTQSLLEQEQDLSPRLRSYLETVRRVVDDVTATVGRMRDFSRKREPDMTLAPVNLNLLVQQVIDLTRARWSDMQQQQGGVITATAILEPDLPAIMGVEGEIREALTNLIFNAVDAMPNGGSMTLSTGIVSVEGPPRHVYVEVRDTGTGMNEETKQRIFEPFFTTKGERGTGLGMAMVYGVAQRHSAEIEIDSAPGAGTAARLIFMARTPMAREESPAAKPAVPTKPLRILIVDDDPFVLDSMRMVLELDGHDVSTASGGQDGIDSVRNAQTNGGYQVVITDLGMPYVDGNQVARAVKTMAPATRVVLLTGWGRRMTADGTMPPGVDHLLGKPPELNELRAVLARCA